MTPGAYVRIRYATTQFDSVPPFIWRRLKVEKAGRNKECELGDSDDMREGWWYTQSPYYWYRLQNFFLKERILEVILDPDYT